jgi:hypothetical protein
MQLNLDDKEVSALFQIFDRALRQSGMEAFDAVAYFRQKIATAQNPSQNVRPNIPK